MSILLHVTRDRYQPAPTVCTLGRLVFGGRSFDTLEPPLEDTFPAAEYRVEPRNSDAFGVHWVLVNPLVGAYDDPARGTLFLLRTGSCACDLINALGVGKTRCRTPEGGWVLRDARAAMNELRTTLGGAFDVKLILK